jgi:hypothetical protein
MTSGRWLMEKWKMKNEEWKMKNAKESGLPGGTT